MIPNLKILVADDDPDHVQLITEILNQELKAEVESVTKGEECLKKVMKNRYDLLLLDYFFPETNGLDILKEIVEKGKDLPIIIITGHGTEKVAVEAMKAGAIDYIVKSEDGFQSLPFAAKRAIEKDQLRKKLRQSEEKFKNLFEGASDAIIYLDRAGRILEANKQAAEVFGVSKPEVLGKQLIRLDIFPPEEIPTFLNSFADILAGREVTQDVCIKNKKGQEIALECSTSLTKTDDKVTGVMFIARDISERKRAEEALKKSSQLLRDTGEMAKVGGWELDLSTKEVLWTEEVGRIHGVEPGYKPKLEEALNFYAPESRPALEEVLKKAAETGEPYDFESLFIPSGSKDKIWVRSLGKAVTSGGKIVKLAGTFQNIDKYKRAEEALRESEGRYRHLFEAESDAIFLIDNETGRILEANNTALALYGYSREELLTKKNTDLSSEPEETQRVTRGTPAIAESVMAIPIRLHRKKDGTVFPAEITGRFFIWQGRLVHIAAIRDITERKRAESQREATLEEVRRKEKELQEKNDELTRFTYAVSHDLRSPLVTIQTFQDHLERDIRSRDAARMEKDLGYIRSAADKMGRLIDDIRRLSRIGRITNPSEEAPLQAIVKEALDLVAGRITTRGVRVDPTEEAVVLYGDRPRLVEVFMNLVDNAVKFMGDEPAPRVEIGVEQAGEELVLHVRDNGIGIDPQVQPLVFGLFHKVDPDSQGEGVGLALVKRIVELHGGRIWVESEGLGKGATFRFTLAKTRRGAGRIS
jgi:PAS domain S-box-containing protein